MKTRYLLRYLRDHLIAVGDTADYMVNSPRAGIETTEQDLDYFKKTLADSRKFLKEQGLGPKWKIQFGGVNGWWDLKSSSGGPYTTELYDTKKDARADVREMRKGTTGPHEKYRIVSETTPEEWSPYCD